MHNSFDQSRIPLFDSIERIKSRSDLRDQFRSTLAGFGKCLSFGHKFGATLSEAWQATAALMLLHLDLDLFFSSPERKIYHANLISLLIKMGVLRILPTIHFLETLDRGFYDKLQGYLESVILVSPLKVLT